jgi:hypothetical protein
LSKTLASLVFPSISTPVSIPILNHCHKPRQLAPTMGLTRFIYVRSLVFKLASKFLRGLRLVFGSLLFITDKMGNLSLQEPESREIVRSNIDRLPPTLVRVSLACEAWPRHRSTRLLECESDPSGDNINHHEIYCPDAVDSIYKPSSESDSDGG